MSPGAAAGQHRGDDTQPTSSAGTGDAELAALVAEGRHDDDVVHHPG
jgi:hypothetical protein